MRMRERKAALLGACMVFGCLGGSQVGCVSRTEGRAAVETALAQKPGDKVHAKAPRFAPMPLKPGQWARYLVGANAPRPAVYTIKVLDAGEIPFSYWFEEEWLDENKVVVARSQVLMDEARVVVATAQSGFDPVMTDYGRNVRTIVSENRARASEIPRAELQPGLWVMRSRVALFGGAVVTRARKVAVRGGQFKGCYDARGMINMDGREGPIAGCLDSSVPLHGLVEGRDALGRQWELLAFDYSGAKSALP